MKIFSDKHHAGLAASLNYLFEDRLGHKVYFPIGLDWHSKGYWKIATLYGDAIETINQYLSCPPFPTVEEGVDNPEDGVYYISDRAHDVMQKYITLNKFADDPPDVVIASLPQHIAPFKKLIQDFAPKAKFIYHIGNVGWHTIIPWNEVTNVMASVKPFPHPDGKNIVFYKQEFPVEIFLNDTISDKKKIATFVNCLPQPIKWETLKNYLTEYEMKAHGISGPDGVVSGLDKMAAIMKECRFGYHNKPEGDGFGHVIHNWMAAGRPIIVNKKDYEDKLAGEMLINGVTCIDMSHGDMRKVAQVVREISDLQYADMVNAVRNKFKEVVNFEEDAQRVKDFINNLL